MHLYPQSKQYKYIIPTIKGDCVLRFQQATAQETSEYIEILKLCHSEVFTEKLQWLELKRNYILWLITKNYQVKRYEFRKKMIRNIVIENIWDYIGDILDMLHVFRDSVYKWVNPPRVKWQQNRQARFEWLYEVIANSTGIPMDEIPHRLTTEQIWWYSDKIVFSNYEQFKEWKALNDKVFGGSGLSREQQEALDIIKANLHNKETQWA